MNIHYLELIFPALVIMISAAVFLTRYKRCPKDKILVIWGALLGGGGERSSKCIHGGGAFVWPLVQDFSYLSLEPLNIEIQAMTITSDNKYVDVSMDFSVQISLEEEVMYNAADCLLNQSSDAIKDMARHEYRFSLFMLTANNLQKSVTHQWVKTRGWLIQDNNRSIIH